MPGMCKEIGISKMSVKNYTIPVWFVGLAKYSMIFIVPWVCWVSMNIHTMCVNQQIIIKQLEEIKAGQE